MPTNNSINTGLSGQTGSGSFVGSTSPTLTNPDLGTPSAGVLTNCTGVALGLTAGSTVFGPNLTGPIASSGVVTSITSQTGIGTKFVVDDSPTLITPNLGTPSAGVLTNCTGTALGLTAGNVASIPNLTGPITSVGTTTSIASQTGIGSTIVVDNSPTLITPNIGVASATSVNKVSITAPATSATLSISDGKTATVSNTLSFIGVDGSSVNFGSGGTVLYASTALTNVVMQVFTASGTYTPTVGMKYCIIEVIGGGGGGGGVSGALGQTACGAGGGAGGYSRGRYTNVNIGVSQSVTIGASGAGGPAGNNNGSSGGTSSVGALINATGGAGGAGQASSVTLTYSGAGGAGGLGALGSFDVQGAPGLRGSKQAAAAISGAGGNSAYGGGGAPSFGSSAGAAGGNFGSGGSGASSIAAVNSAGGAGSNGAVIITEFI